MFKKNHGLFNEGKGFSVFTWNPPSHLPPLWAGFLKRYRKYVTNSDGPLFKVHNTSMVALLWRPIAKTSNSDPEKKENKIIFAIYYISVFIPPWKISQLLKKFKFCICFSYSNFRQIWIRIRRLNWIQIQFRPDLQHWPEPSLFQHNFVSVVSQHILVSVLEYILFLKHITVGKSKRQIISLIFHGKTSFI